MTISAILMLDCIHVRLQSHPRSSVSPFQSSVTIPLKLSSFVRYHLKRFQTTSTTDLIFFFPVPEPTSVVITSYPSHPIKAGTEVTLTCTVLLNHTLAGIPTLDMGVTVVWIGPLGVLEAGVDASATAEDPLVYISVLHISSAVANESYTCQASVDSMSSSLASSRVGIDYFTITTGTSVKSIELARSFSLLLLHMCFHVTSKEELGSSYSLIEWFIYAQYGLCACNR